MTSAQIRAWQESGRPVLLGDQPVTVLRTADRLGCCGWHVRAEVLLRNSDTMTHWVDLNDLRLGSRVALGQS